MIIAAVSGGLDSAAMAWRFLTMGDEPVHIHHVSLRNRQARRTGRWEAEEAAMERIVPFLRANCRPFAYTASAIEAGVDCDIVAVTEQVARMIVAKQLPMPSAFARGANAHDMASDSVAGRQGRALARWQHHLGPKAPPIIFPIGYLTRAKYVAEMPAELVALTWSCRQPQKVAERRVPCRECRTCREMVAEGIPLERNLTMEMA